MRMRKNSHDPMCLLRSTCTYYFFYLKKKIGTLEQLCHIIKSKIVKGQKSHFPFRNCLCLSQWLNPSPSAVNPIFPVYKKANPSSHRQDPLQIMSENGDLFQKSNIKKQNPVEEVDSKTQLLLQCINCLHYKVISLNCECM